MTHELIEQAASRFGDRSLFPTLEARAYLNHAAISPVSTPVREAAAQVLEDYARDGFYGYQQWTPRREDLRNKLATLVGGRGEDIGFVPNTSQGIMNVALCFPWTRGDRVVLFRGEFPANVTPWQRAAELFELEIVWMSLESFWRSHDEGLGELERILDSGTTGSGIRLVATSAVQFQTGLRMPVPKMASLCRKYGAQMFVDAIQACGAVPLDVGVGIDYLSCGSHKWLMGIEGAAFLYVAPHRIGSLRPHVAGWRSHEQPFDFLMHGAGHLNYERPIRAKADFVEQGAQNVVGYAALEASLDLITSLGVDQVFAHIQRWHDAAEPALVALGLRSRRTSHSDGRSGSLTFELPERASFELFVQSLRDQGIAGSTPDGLIRFSPHWPNSIHEVDLLVRSVESALAVSTR